jgi:outer membrane protein
MGNRIRRQLTAMGIAVSLGTVGTTTLAADLATVYDMAKNNDPTFIAEQFQLEAGQLSVPLARSALKPSISVDGAYRQRNQDISGPNTNSDDTFGVGDAQIALTQALFDRPSRVAVDQAEDLATQSGIEYEIAEEELILRVGQRYFAVLATEDNLDLAQSNKKAIQRQLELAQERLNVGLGTRTDLFQSRSRFELAVADEIEALKLIDDAKQALIELVGEDPGDLMKLDEDAPITDPAPADVQDWIGRAQTNNRALQSEFLTTDIAEKEIDRQQAARYPLVDLGLSSSYSDNRGTRTDSTTNDIGLRLSIPLYLGGLISNRVKEAALNHNTSLQRLESTRRAVERGTRDAYFDVLAKVRRVEALKEAVIAAEATVEAKEEGFSAGLITNLDVLDAQRDLFAAQRNYLSERYEYILAVFTLEQAVGTLDIEDINRVNGWLAAN